MNSVGTIGKVTKGFIIIIHNYTLFIQKDEHITSHLRQHMLKQLSCHNGLAVYFAKVAHSISSKMQDILFRSRSPSHLSI